MRESALLIAFILLIVGIIGLMINELIFDWGRCATLTFAIINVIGLVILFIVNWGLRRVSSCYLVIPKI